MKVLRIHTLSCNFREKIQNFPPKNIPGLDFKVVAHHYLARVSMVLTYHIGLLLHVNNEYTK